MKPIYTLFLLALSLSAAHAQTGRCPMVGIGMERLPDMNIAREGHTPVFVGGELTAIGGHTAGFIPTSTAEYLKDGEWHLMEMVYTHDNGTVLHMNDGRVLIAGGHAEPLGIGQTFTAEYYMPCEHRFEGFGCMEVKRALASAVEMEEGEVLIGGNWYAADAMEMFDGKHTFRKLKDATAHRGRTHLLRCAADDAIAFGEALKDGRPVPCDTIDRLRGEPFTEPLLQEWCFINHNAAPTPLGSSTHERYTYIYLAKRFDNGRYGLFRVCGTRFEPLPTDTPIPTASRWGQIEYGGSVAVDTIARRAYVLGGGKSDRRYYVLAADYSHDPALLTLYYTEPVDTLFGSTIPLIDDGGNIIIVGGMDHNNFRPTNRVVRLMVGQHAGRSAHSSAAKGAGLRLWQVAIGLAVLAIVLPIVLSSRCKRRPATVMEGNVQKAADANVPTGLQLDEDAEENEEKPDIEKEEDGMPPPTERRTESIAELSERIDRTMREQKLYLDPHLKSSTFVRIIGSNRNYVYQAINVEMGMSFSEYVNRLRVDHAEQLIHEHPDWPIADIAIRSGFASNVSFYRNYKIFKGQPPSKDKKAKS